MANNTDGVKAKWVKRGCVKKPNYDPTTDWNAYAYRCSNCERVSYMPIGYLDRYCRRCGARMANGENEEQPL